MSFMILSNPGFARAETKCGNRAAASSNQTIEKKNRVAEFVYEKRGYVVVAAIMVATMATANYLSSLLPHGVLTDVVALVSAFGIYDATRPMLGPLSSRIQKFSFQFFAPKNDSSSSTYEENIWMGSQNRRSPNAQMSRNLIVGLINSVHQNFYEAYHAIQRNEPTYAASQIAAAAKTMKDLADEIPPDNKNIALSMRTAFTHHVYLRPEFVDEVRQMISEFDPEASNHSEYYEKLLKTWFNQNVP